MKRIVVLILCLFFVHSAYTKTKRTGLELDSSLYTFMYKHIRYPAALSAICSMPATYIQIKVSGQGIIGGINFSKNTPVEIINEITRVINLSKKYDFYKSFKGKIIVMPLFFYLINNDTKSNCNYREALEKQMELISNNKTIDLETYTYLPPIVINGYVSLQKRQ